MSAEFEAEAARIPEEKVKHIPGLHPDVVKAFEEQKEDRASELEREAVKIVDNFDSDFTLSSWGYTDELKVTRGAKILPFKLRIKAVGVQDVVERTDKKQPRPPSSYKTYKKNSPEANNAGANTALLVREVDYSDPAYMVAVDEHQRRSGQIVILAALAYDWYDKDGKLILRGADIDIPTEIIDEEACLQKLRSLRLTSTHLTTILKNVRDLTADEDRRENLE